MPEGDTIFRAARTLNRALVGSVVTQFETVFPRLSRVDFDEGICGRTVEHVEARGKWLLVQFSRGPILLTHMLMSGIWHIYRPGESWRLPRSAKVTIGKPGPRGGRGPAQTVRCGRDRKCFQVGHLFRLWCTSV